MSPEVRLIWIASVCQAMTQQNVRGYDPRGAIDFWIAITCRAMTQQNVRGDDPRGANDFGRSYLQGEDPAEPTWVMTQGERKLCPKLCAFVAARRAPQRHCAVEVGNVIERTL